jgi:inorganic triphosphatase YgiF
MTAPLTLLAPPGSVERLRLAPIIARHVSNNGVVRRVEVTYFDTPERTLFDKGLSLRVQRSGARQIQQLRREARRSGSGEQRWETPVEGAAPDLSRLPAPDLSDVLADLDGVTLAPVFTRRIRCRVQRVQLPEATVSVAFNEGVVEAGERAEPVAEVQLQLQSGDPGAVYELGAQLLDVDSLRLATVSECDRGFALALGIAPRPAKALQPEIARFHVVDDAIAVLLDACRRHLVENQAAAEDGRDPEGVHQLRVALRRLRSALSLLRREVSAPSLQSFREEASRLASALGPAREWDVFLAETLAQPEEACAAGVPFAPLREAAARRRDASYAVVRAALADPRTTRFQLQLSQWIERRGWRNEITAETLPVLSEPVSGLAARLLSWRYRKALKRGDHLRRLDAAGRHRLRVQLKGLRYACEFFLPLWPGEAGEHFVSRLALLQATLGADSDAEATGALLRTLGEAETMPALERAIGAVIGWQARDRLAALQRLRRRWRRFKTMAPFWEG